MSDARNGLWVEVHCRNCGGMLHEVQPGRTDGAVGYWSAECESCHRGYVLRLELAAVSVPKRSPGRHANHGSAARYRAGCRCDQCTNHEKKGAA